MSSQSEIGIVCSGGGMTCAYSCGALEALYYYYGLKYPKVLIGASGSAGSCAYFAAGQINVGREIWCNQLSNGQFISLKRYPFMDVSYIINTVFKKRVPLNIGAVRTNPTKLLIPTTNIETGLLTYYSNHDSGIDLFKVLQAAKTIPFIAGNSVCIENTCRHIYTDGDLAGQLEHHTSLARSYDCDKIIVIDSGKNYDWKGRTLATLLGLFSNGGIRHALQRGLDDDRTEVVSDEHTIVVRPSRPLQMHALSDKKELLERAYDLGYQDAVNHPELKKLLS